MKELTEVEKKETLTALYDAWIRKVKRLLLIGASVLPVAFVIWRVVTPLLPSRIQDEASLISALLFGLAVYVVFGSLILWPVFVWEKMKRLRERDW